MACETCGKIPDTLTANTGREQYLPESVAALTRLKLSFRDQDLYRCPSCDALFHWTEDVAFTGSGNNDSETLTRLSDAEANLVRPLLDLSERSDRPGLVRKAFDAVSPDRLELALRHLVWRLPPAASASIVPEIVDRLLRSDDPLCSGLLESYYGVDRERAERVSLLLAEDPRPKGSRTQFLIGRLAKLLSRPQA